MPKIKVTTPAIVLFIAMALKSLSPDSRPSWVVFIAFKMAIYEVYRSIEIRCGSSVIRWAQVKSRTAITVLVIRVMEIELRMRL